MVSFKGVVFDVDGVLVDSEPLAFRAWQELMAPFNKTLDGADYQAMLGIDLQTSARYVIHRTNLQRSPQELMETFWEHIYEIMPGALVPLPGVSALVPRLAQMGCSLGVASNSIRGYVEKVLEAIQLRQYFLVVMTRDQVADGKPAPDLYLAAVAGMGCSPEDCLAIEDSQIGLRSAIAAGLRTVLVSSQNPPNGLKPWMQVRSLEEVNRVFF